MNPLARPYFPGNPAPGIYAISATTLQGVHFNNHDLFAWFRTRESFDKIGYSIFLYEVPAQSERVDVALGNIQLDEINTADFDQLGTNNIVPHWFDPSQALPVMDGAMSAVILPPETTFPQPLAVVFDETYAPVYSGRTATIFEPAFAERPLIALLLNQGFIAWQTEQSAVFTHNAGQIGLQAFYLPDSHLEPGGNLVVLTLSHLMADPVPVKMFLHLTAPDGEITAQWDSLGIVWQSWTMGDGLIQQHALPLPDGLSQGEFQLWAGYYDPDSLSRWTTVNERGEVIDRVPLEVLIFQ
jgi:hypothetical protein